MFPHTVLSRACLPFQQFRIYQLVEYSLQVDWQLTYEVVSGFIFRQVLFRYTYKHTPPFSLHLGTGPYFPLGFAPDISRDTLAFRVAMEFINPPYSQGTGGNDRTRTCDAFALD